MRSDKIVKKLRPYILSVIILLYGCSITPKGRNSFSEQIRQETFVLEEITTDQAKAILSGLNLDTISYLPDSNTILMEGSPSELAKIDTILDLIDANDLYIMKALAPTLFARYLPSNEQIAEAIDDLTIGTFVLPPQSGECARGIIDFFDDKVIAIVPERFWPEICAAVKPGNETVNAREKVAPPEVPNSESNPISTNGQSTDHSDGNERDESMLSAAASDNASSQAIEFRGMPIFKSSTSNPRPDAQSENGADSVVDAEELSLRESEAVKKDVSEAKPIVALPARNEPVVSRGVLRPFREVSESAKADEASPVVSFSNGDDIIELSLPETIDLVQLLDLVSEYLHLDCIYDPEEIKGHAVTLKLRSKLRSELRVKDLYALLETVLKSEGFAMTRQEGNLVSIVPAIEALDVDPEFVDPNTRTLQAGNMVITRVFELQHVDVASVTNLLQNMKLSVAVSPIEETQTLFVTCYAHRMSRIERLVNMVDRLGRPKEFRFRQLKYTAAGMLSQKILKLAEELQSVSIVIAKEQREPTTTVSLSSQRAKGAESGRGTRSAGGQAVYLDTDERTNRVLMIGYQEQLETVEGLIDVLDIPQQDLRIPRVYHVENLQAHDVLQKLQELSVLGPSGISKSPSNKTASNASLVKVGTTYDLALADDPQVVVLEATNQLLVNASQEQHARVHEFLDYIDVSPDDPRILKIYKINYVEAEDITRKLEELDIIGADSARSSRSTAPATTAKTPTTTADTTADTLVEESRIVVIEQTNSLMLNATPEQHNQITALLNHLDCKMEEIPYQFYPLENQSPDHLATVLQNLIQETVQDKDGKIEKATTKQEEIKIVSDPNTFSLIVYASKKNQEWIAGLIEKLDKRRPQVLIDVSLVEVSRTDEFDLDLQLATKFPKLNPGEQMSAVGSIISPFIEKTGEVFSSPKTGTAQGFYTDDHIQALLTAIQSKSYGRVLAKPKILVNDGQPGTIKTIDKTSVKIESIIIPEQGTQRTTTDFKEYEAGITLTITPNISEGDLLLLQVELDRTDFLQRSDINVPPDTTASNINTIVTVPDGRTIILGGLLKLNQTKGGTKVPLLGDIPLVGGLFRSTSNTDNESRLYVFLKANILRPDETEMGLSELEKVSERIRTAFETHEETFQKYEDWPGLKYRPVNPSKVLEIQ